MFTKYQTLSFMGGMLLGVLGTYEFVNYINSKDKEIIPGQKIDTVTNFYQSLPVDSYERGSFEREVDIAFDLKTGTGYCADSKGKGRKLLLDKDGSVVASVQLEKGESSDDLRRKIRTERENYRLAGNDIVNPEDPLKWPGYPTTRSCDDGLGVELALQRYVGNEDYGFSYEEMIDRQSELVGIEENSIRELFTGIPLVESKYDQRAISPAKATGVGQLMPGTKESCGLDKFTEFDVLKNIECSLESFLRRIDIAKNELIENHGEDPRNDELALYFAIQSYNSGEGNVRKVIHSDTFDAFMRRDDLSLEDIVHGSVKHSFGTGNVSKIGEDGTGYLPKVLLARELILNAEAENAQWYQILTIAQGLANYRDREALGFKSFSEKIGDTFDSVQERYNRIASTMN